MSRARGAAHQEALSEEQRLVVLAPPGPTLVLAGAGSGKTRALVHRLAHLLAQGVPPARLLLMTFTTAAAREMLGRTAALLGGAGEGAAQGSSPAGDRPPALQELWAGTFHHVALRLLRRHGRRLGLRDGFSVLDGHDAEELLAACLAARGARARPRLLSRLLSLSVGGERPLAQVLERHAPPLLEELPLLCGVLDDYARRKLQMGALDFDDLLLLLRLLLHDDPALRAEVSDQFLHVLVDEYQDTSPLEAALVDQLAAGHGSLFVVGDDAQAIYGFRGGDVRSILDFPARWPGARVLHLQANHRSAPPIVALANASIRCNRLRFDKEMRAERPAVAPPQRPALVPLLDEGAQAAFVAARCLDLLRAGRRPGDLAVLYRAHAHGEALQRELSLRRVPFRLRSGTPLLSQAHVKDVLCHLRLLDNPRDEVALRRVQRVGLGDGLLQELRQAALGEGEAPAALVERVLRGGYEAHLRRSFPDADGRLLGLRRLAASLSGPLKEVLAELSLRGQEGAAGGEEPDGDVVTLSTVHRAKGLEWPVVFVIGLGEGRFPGPAVSAVSELEEERRLFYVAVTRARDELYLCCPLGRMSRFLRELDGPDCPFERWQVLQGEGA